MYAMANYAVDLCGNKVEESKVLIVQQNDTVNQHDTDIRTKALQLVPPLQPLSAYELQSLQIQKATADDQKALMDLVLESRKKDQSEQ